jgi:hypothetical protein
MPANPYIVMLIVFILACIPAVGHTKELQQSSSNDFYLKCVGQETRIYNDKTTEQGQIQDYYHVANGRLYVLSDELGALDPQDILTPVLQPEWVDKCDGKNQCVINSETIEVSAQGNTDAGEDTNYLSINRLTGFFSRRATSHKNSYLRVATSWTAQGTCTKIQNPTPAKF